MNTRVLVALVLASCLAAPSAAAQCGARLRDTDRAELVPRTVHGLAYLEHPTLGFRLLAPGFARASDAAEEPLAHRWRWEAAGEHVEVRITCDDRAPERGFVRVFAIERARGSSATLVQERHEPGISMIEQRDASGATVTTRHRLLSTPDRSFVLSVSASHRDTSTSLRMVASALPPTTLAGADRSREDIRAAIRRSILDFRICYERSDAIERRVSGRVTVAFVVDQAGDVRNAAISESTLGHAQVEGCVRQTVRLLRFGARTEPGLIGVNYPFVFDTQP